MRRFQSSSPGYVMQSTTPPGRFSLSSPVRWKEEHGAAKRAQRQECQVTLAPERGKGEPMRMARTLQKQLIRVQAQTFADWCAEVRDLAGERWPEVADQCATLYAVWGGGATPAQALYMVGLILPPKAAA
jgi:hypothetical protein